MKNKGVYKGKPASPDTVKYKTDFQGIAIHVDRPKGFVLSGQDSDGNDWQRTYKYDYGFIPKTLGGDKEGIDVFIGPNKKAKKAFWAVQCKPDGSFDEYKVFLGFDNQKQVESVYAAHIPKKFLKRIMNTSVEMMKALLGKEPRDLKKVLATNERQMEYCAICNRPGGAAFSLPLRVLGIDGDCAHVSCIKFANKKQDKKRVELDTRPEPNPFFSNYDYTSSGPNETSPGGSPWYGKPGGGEKSLGDWIKKRRKKQKKVNKQREARAQYFGLLIKGS